LLWELGTIEVGVGTLQKTNQPVAAAVKPAINALWEWAREQSNVPVDETPWCVMGVKEWLWTASGEGFCLFHAADTFVTCGTRNHAGQRICWSLKLR
jgi:transposase